MSQREKVIEQAARMFVELGIKSIRMDDIAHTLGISKRTLYEMFADKEELIYLCMKHLLDEQIREVDEIASKSENKIEAMFCSFKMMLEGGERHHRMMTNLQKFYPAVYEHLRTDQIRGGVGRLRKLIISYIDLGLINRNTNVDISVIVFYYTATSIMGHLNNIVLPEGVSEKSALMYAVVNFFRGIASEEGIRQIDKLVAENDLYNIK